MSIEKEMLDQREQQCVEKRLPDSDGWWWIDCPDGPTVVRVKMEDNNTLLWTGNNTWRQCPEGRYIKAEPPEFVGYPPKPPQVLMKLDASYMWYALEHKGSAQNIINACWRLVDHPDNDPEGVRMIEEARK